VHTIAVALENFFLTCEKFYQLNDSDNFFNSSARMSQKVMMIMIGMQYKICKRLHFAGYTSVAIVFSLHRN